ncbi:MAG: ABC transporter ATP-binding protein [Deltaproteobacteria bacterium]|nr:ABC transporter ATP-binding protein [Deltaproteobacteria bacterium]MBW2070594.1 ABC transporter ATP-binding protein [Deltaproteobacteria bacterium]
MNQFAIEIRGIEKIYPAAGGNPAVHALKGIDLSIESSKIFCILGPNGAGKTTLITIMSGLLYPDAGMGRVWGLDLLRERRKIRSIVNFASGHANLPDNFTVDETLTYFGMLYGLGRAERLKKRDELASFFELDSYRKIPFNQLSTGLKQRLALAKSLINEPRILFLDEPTVGLDPQVAALIRSRLLQWHREKGITIILTTHQMDEAEQMSDCLGFLNDGRFVRIGNAAELKRGIQFQETITIFGKKLSAASAVLTGIAGVSLISGEQNQLSCRVDSREKRINALIEAVLCSGGIIENLSISEPSLGDVFVALAERPDSD